MSKEKGNLMGKYGTTEKAARGKEMVDLVKMICGKCNGAITYKIREQCFNCGYIEIKCKKCSYMFNFGE